MAKKKKITLIDNWKEAWKLYSVQINLIGLIVLSVLVQLPNHLLVVWASLPEEWKGFVSQENLVYVGMGFMILSTVSRVIAQTKGDEIEEAINNKKRTKRKRVSTTTETKSVEADAETSTDN